MALRPLTLNIISDSICPFCYLGYKQITLAIQQAQKENLPLEFQLRFKPFLLDPSLALDKPVNKRERLSSKFGASRVEGIERQMIARGKEVGIQFSFGGSMRQTTDSHRLIEKAYQVGGQAKQRAVVEALFAGYFEHEKDVGDHAFLAECAANAGVLTKEDALVFLASNELKDNVGKDIKEAMQLGVEGVPFVILDNKYAVSGAQGTETFLGIFRKIASGKKLAVESDEGDVC
ncbi:thioredoxin-like protein [Mycena maculata]|uniref:Thioredoxin-like protein n=1 Tax=Mycena maculata TaxID=230809 RepID=A0AAD7JKR3_9AGAR|nr:thioredoxin-like protein [Mycena maculata]